MNLPNETSSYPHDDFPMVGLVNQDLLSWTKAIPTSEIFFSGLSQNFCVSYVDIVGSTRIAAKLSGDQIIKYYGLFLNSMAIIATNFGAKIIKNVGDSLIFCFPNATDPSKLEEFKKVIESGIWMISAQRFVNAKLSLLGLPPLSYRISADYGIVEIAKSGSGGEDLFGSIMNLCAKINSKAAPNGMVIGKNLYETVKHLDDYTFKEVGEYAIGDDSHYSIYSVSTKQKRYILNPFDGSINFRF